MSYELYVEPEALDELKRLARRHRPAVVPCAKIGLVVAQAETFVSELHQGHHARMLIETVVSGRIWHHQIPDSFLGSGPPSLDARILVGTHVASLFHIAEVTPGAAIRQSVPGDDVLQAVARSLIDREDDDAS